MELIITTSVICVVILLLMQKTRWQATGAGRLSEGRWHYSKTLIFAFWFAVTFIAAFREGFQDTGVYKNLYEDIGSEYENAFDEDFIIQDRGFNLYMIFLNRISPDPQLMIAVSAILINGVYIHTISKYSSDLPFSLLLFLFVPFIGTMNGIRQVLAGAVVMLALPFIRDRKIIPFMLIALIATSLHASALIMIPLYFIISGKRYNGGVWLFLLFVAFCFAAPSTAYQLMGTILEDSVYEKYLQNEAKMGFMRFLVELVPVIVSFLYHRVEIMRMRNGIPNRLDSRSRRMIDILINMQIVSLGFTALGIQMVYFARISMYFSLVLPLLLPVTISNVFSGHSAKQVKRIAIVMYLFYFAYQVYTYEMLDGWGGMELIF